MQVAGDTQITRTEICQYAKNAQAQNDQHILS